MPPRDSKPSQQGEQTYWKELIIKQKCKRRNCGEIFILLPHPQHTMGHPKSVPSSPESLIQYQHLQLEHQAKASCLKPSHEDEDSCATSPASDARVISV
jgi:hypothetical protein